MRRERARDIDIAGLADAQHGVVARTQLLGLGLSVDAIDHRVRAGRLHTIHRGVYAVGHRVLGIEGRWMATVLAAGNGAALSHASAAAAWELRPVGSGPTHVTIPGDSGRRRCSGIRIHRSATLRPEHTTTHRGIPITVPVRTLIDLAATLKGRSLEHVLDRAEYRNLVDFTELQQHLTAHPTWPGSPCLQAMLSRYTASTLTRSELEERFLRLCDNHGLQRPEANTRIEGVEVDFAWRAALLIVEVDGYTFHRSPSAFEADRRRDVILTLAGWRVLRFTHRQISRRPAWVAAAIANALAR
jgi:very-short-patch-repair endonuclease